MYYKQNCPILYKNLYKKKYSSLQSNTIKSIELFQLNSTNKKKRILALLGFKKSWRHDVITIYSSHCEWQISNSFTQYDMSFQKKTSQYRNTTILPPLISISYTSCSAVSCSKHRFPDQLIQCSRSADSFSLPRPLERDSTYERKSCRPCTISIVIPWRRDIPRKRCHIISARPRSSVRGGDFGLSWPKQKRWKLCIINLDWRIFLVNFKVMVPNCSIYCPD